MAARYLVFFAVGLLVLGGAHYYLWARLVRDVALPAPWFRVATISLGLLFVCLMSAFVLGRVLSRSVASPLMWLSYTWLGALFFLVIALALTGLAKSVTVRSVAGVPDDPERR